MNRLARLVRAKASRWVPGVKVPVAAPNAAVVTEREPPSAASCFSDRWAAAGNWLGLGCSAAASSSTAGAGVVLLAAGTAGWRWEADGDLPAPQPAASRQ